MDFSRSASCLHSSPSTYSQLHEEKSLILSLSYPVQSIFQGNSLRPHPSLFTLGFDYMQDETQTSVPKVTHQAQSISNLNTTLTWSRVLQPSTKTPTGCVSCKLSFSSFSSKSCGRRLSSYKHRIYRNRISKARFSTTIPLWCLLISFIRQRKISERKCYHKLNTLLKTRKIQMETGI